MAITKIHAIKSTLGKALAYIENPDKTDGQMLVSGYNCEPQTASIDFEMTAVLAHKARNLKRKRSTNLAYHLIQSFSPEDAVTPEQAHELGKKLAFEYTGGKYEYVVATHIDKGHIHNHIMINAVSFYDYKKLRTVPYRTARQIRDISDRLCMHHEPLDEIVYCEVMFDKEISGEVPEHRTFIYETAIPWLRRAGLNVKILRANTTYKECFTKTIQRGKGKGKLKGFPLCGRCNIQRDCKVRPIQKYMKSLPQDTQQYVGLATDEQDRLMRLQEKQISLLEQYACSESEAWELCHRYGLLSPVYDFTDRNGCWFCPNAKLPELRHLYDHHPDLWREMLALQALPNKATEKFNRELRFSDYDILFHNEDAQLCWFTQ